MVKADFPSKKVFKKHVEKHIREYGDVNEYEYLNIARELLAAQLSDDVEGFTNDMGFTFKYRKSTNDFDVGRPDGKISTLFKPNNQIEYWEEQIKK